MIAQQSGFTKKLIPAGIYPGYCFALIGVGEIKNWKDMQSVRLIFELPTVQWTDDETGATGPKTISEKFALTLGNYTRPSELALFLQQWRNKEFTEKDFSTFDTKNILSAPACLRITEEKSQSGSRYNKIKRIDPAKKHPDGNLFCPGPIPSETTDFPPPQTPAIYFDPNQPIDPQVLAQIPKWVVKEMIRNNAIPDPEEQSHSHHSQPPQESAPTPQSYPQADADDIPF